MASSSSSSSSSSLNSPIFLNENSLEKPFESSSNGIVVERPELKGDHLSLFGMNIETIPESLGETYGDIVKHLDLSHNQLTKLDNLERFTHLTSLVADNNQLQSSQISIKNSSLQTLWVNNNNIDDLKTFLDCIEKAFPNLTYLSMLKNPACPNYFTGGDADDYQRYRYYVLYRLRNLKFLDSTPVSAAERKEASRVGPYMITARPDSSQYHRNDISEDIRSQDPLPILPGNLQPEGKGPARFGMTTYVYYGKHSEGNRFIMNDEL